MNRNRQSSFFPAAALPLIILSVFSPASLHAADAVQVVGDLKVDGLYFSGDSTNTLITKPSDFPAPWTISGSDIYYTTGNVGIGTPTPSQRLEVNGTVKATAFQGDGAGLTNIAATIADGSVTDAKISGPISAAKLDLSTVQKKYGKVAVVAQSGGDYGNPATAMNDLAAWCGTPSSSNPCLLKIMPGVYSVSSPGLIMQPYVDIEGSGERMTKITSTLSSLSNPPTDATVSGATNAEIRFATVENTATGNYTTALYNNSSSPSLLHITITSSGGTNSYGLYNRSSSPEMMSVTVSVTAGTNAYGIFNESSSSPTMTNVTATVSGGSSKNYGVYNSGSSAPRMSSVTAIVSGGLYPYGVFNDHSSPTMINVSAIVGSSPYPTGISNSFSSPAMTDVTVSASGGINAYGVYNKSSAPKLTNVTVTASAATKSFGIYNEIDPILKTSATVKINHSVIAGLTNTIYNGVGMTALVGNSQLDGGVVSNAGTLTCTGTYSGSYAALNSTCQ